MADEKKPDQANEQEIIVIPESEAPKMSSGLFEPDKNHVLVYMKFMSMNQPFLVARSHHIEDAISSNENPGYFLYGEVAEMRRFLHENLDKCMDEAKESAKLNP